MDSLYKSQSFFLLYDKMLLIFKLFCPIKLLLALDKLQLIENNLSTEADVGGKASIHRNYPILKNRTKTQLFFQVPCLS